MLNKLLFKYQRFGQMIIAFLGTLLGLSFLLISIQFYFDLKNVLQEEKEILGPNTFILQKKVSSLNALSLGNTAFSDNDIKDISNLDFVVKLDSFKTSNFDVSIKMASGKNLPYFRTDAFVQSLPQTYFSDVTADWNWAPDNDFVPLVMPEDYLTLYNHAFAPSQGTPQIPKEALYNAILELEIKEKGKVIHSYKCKIVGLTNKINSLLVPARFLKFTNEKYGLQDKEKAPSRIVILTKNNSYSQVEQLIKDKNLETSENLLSKAKIKTYLSIIMIALMVVNFIILVLSLLAFVQYSQIVIYKTEYEIQTLLRIGYSVKTISMSYVKFFAKLFGGISILALILVFLFQLWSSSIMKTMGFEFGSSLYMITYITTILLFLVFTLFNFLNVKSLIKKLL